MFKIMTGCLNPKSNPTDEEIRKIPSFVFCRWLSGNRVAIKAANMINQYYSIPIENQYRMIKAAFAGNIKYIPYPKNVSVDQLKQVDFVGRHFKISDEKAKEYIELMDPHELKYIVDMHTEAELRGNK